MLSVLRSTAWGFALAAAMAASGIVFHERALIASPALALQDRPLFSTKSELVLLSVTVKDKRNEYLTGLTQESFTVFDGGRPQPIKFFMSEDAPATIGLLIDNSGSMQPNRALVVAAATAFAATSNPQDDLFALAFNEQVRAALETASPFTNDPAVLGQALERTVTTRGTTALYDAILRGVEYVDQGSHDRKVLVIVSDGADNASSAGFDQVLQQIQRSNVVIYAVGLVDPVEPHSKWKMLRELADTTGGEMFRPSNIKQVGGVLERIAREIRHTYVVAYEPSEIGTSEGLRRTKVTVRPPDGRQVVVRARAGYLMTSNDSNAGTSRDRAPAQSDAPTEAVEDAR